MSAPFRFPPPPPPPPKVSSGNERGDSSTHDSYRSQSQHGPQNGFQARGGRGNPRGGRGGVDHTRGRGGAYQSRGRGDISQSRGREGRGHHMGLQGGNSQPRRDSHPLNEQARGATNFNQRRGHPSYRGDGPQRGSSGSKPPRQRVPAAPAVPSFGFSLPTPPPQSITVAPSNPRKRKANGLGLIPGDNVRNDAGSSGEEEPPDEEAAWTGPKGPLVVEYNGRTVRLSDASEVRAWVTERKHRFPTSSRIAQRKQDLAERRARLERARVGLTKDDAPLVELKPEVSPASKAEQLRKLRERVEQSRKISLEPDASPGKASQPSARKQPDQPHVYAHTQEQRGRAMTEPNSADVDRAGTLVPANSQASSLGILVNYDTDEESDAISTELEAPSSVVSSDVETSSDSDSSDDEAPEAMSSRGPAVQQPPSQLNRKAVDKTCRDWKEKGQCPGGKNCQWQHPAKPEKARRTLLQRFQEQQQRESDRLALEAIKYLGDKGFLD